MHAILVVDDDSDCGRILARLLTSNGDRAICVSSGKFALDSLLLRIPSLVILDMMMPDMDGLEVLRWIRSNPLTVHLPVIMFSAMSDPAYAIDAISKGATEFWVKGRIDFSTLHQLVAPYMAPLAV